MLIEHSFKLLLCLLQVEKKNSRVEVAERSISPQITGAGCWTCHRHAQVMVTNSVTSNTEAATHPPHTSMVPPIPRHLPPYPTASRVSQVEQVERARLLLSSQVSGCELYKSGNVQIQVRAPSSAHIWFWILESSPPCAFGSSLHPRLKTQLFPTACGRENPCSLTAGGKRAQGVVQAVQFVAGMACVR